MKEIDDNLLEDLVYAIMDSRKEPRNPPPAEPKLPEDLQRIEDIKRARYEALLDKYREEP